MVICNKSGIGLNCLRCEHSIPHSPILIKPQWDLDTSCKTMDVCNLYIGEKYKEIRVKCNWITNKENSRNKRNIKLNLEKANEIRTLYNSGYYTQKELAEKFIVSTSTICNIINNRYWAE